MKCEQARELICSWIALEIQDEDYESLSRHLAECESCRHDSILWRKDDQRLTAHFQPRRQAADHVAQSVISQLLTTRQDTSTQQWQRLLTIVLAAAVGFLLAAVIFQSGTTEPGNQQTVAQSETTTQNEVTSPDHVAKLVATTGPMEFRSDGQTEWQQVSDLTAYLCPADTELRTGPETQCEFSTEDGCVVRLNSNTRLVMESTRCIRLANGEVWCRAPDSVSMEVIAHSNDDQPGQQPVDPLCVFSCPSDGSMLTSLTDSQPKVIAASGVVELVTDSGRHAIQSGQMASIQPDGQVLTSAEQNALLHVGWMDALLMKKQPSDPDLQLRVDSLLAQIGLTKTSYLFERELRGLGEHCVLPLTKFVQSDMSAKYPSRRWTAMRVLSDTSPTWNIGNLIELLSDDDPEIRVMAATALQRLTGETHGRVPNNWNQNIANDDPAITAWQEWWTSNQHRYSQLERTHD